MIEENARIVACEGRHAWVETVRKSACGSCEASGGCGAGALSQVLGTRTNRIRVINTIAAQPGDQVVIGVAEDTLVRGSLAVYAVPLLTLLAGGLFGEYMAGRLLADPDMGGIVGGLVGLGLGLWWLSRYSRSIADDERYQPVTLRRVDMGFQPVHDLRHS